MKKLSILSIIIFLMFVTTVNLVAQEAAADPDPARYQGEIDAFIDWNSRNSFPENGVLFVGSSSIRLWKTRDCFPEFPVINRGFGGAHISDILHYFDVVVLPYKPKVILFYTGDNDIAGKKTPQRVLNDYKKFVALAEQAAPGAKIIYIPIKPSLNRWHLWELMNEANQLIESYSESDPHLFYIDTSTPTLTKDGTPQPDLLLTDGLHLNEKGYALWTKIVKPLLEDVYSQ